MLRDSDLAPFMNSLSSVGWDLLQYNLIVFLLNSNKKSYTLYRMVMMPMTLGDP